MPRSVAIFLLVLLALVTTGARPAAGQQSNVSVSHGAINDLDRAAQQSLQASRMQQNIVLRCIGRAFNWWGGPGVVWFAALCWLGSRIWKRAVVSEIGLRAIEAIAVASALSGIIKGFAGRSRPFHTPGEPWHWSFAHGWTDARYFSMPSGHTTATFAFAAAVTVAAVRVPRFRLVIGLVVFASALLVAFARVYTDQHWLSDVVVGALLGSVTGIVLTRWHNRHPQSAFDRVLLGAQGMAAAPPLRREPAVTSGEAVVLGLTTLTAVAVIPLELRIAAWMRDSAQHRSSLIDNALTGGRLFGPPGSIILGTALGAGIGTVTGLLLVQHLDHRP